MKNLTAYLFWLISISATGCFHLQAQIQGIIIDDETNEKIGLVRIGWLKAKKGTTADLSGYFKIESPDSDDTLRFNYLGYKTKLVPIAAYFSGNLTIKLTPSENIIDPVIITPAENPAHRIIKRAIAAKSTHDPFNYTSFCYTSYNKQRIVANQSNDSLKKPDLPVVIWESVTERSYQKPNYSFEKVIASRLSGAPGALLPFSPTEVQPLSFQTDKVKLLGNTYYSPLIEKAWLHFEFQLVDSLIFDDDTLYTLLFKPKHQSGFYPEGLLRIDTRGYAIQAIEAKFPVPPSLAMIETVNIKQYCKYINGYWFAEQLDTDLKLNVIGNNGSNWQIRSRLQNIIIGCTLKSETKKLAEINNLAIIPNPNPDSIIQIHRTDSLTIKEQQAYQLLDSMIGKNINIGKLTLALIPLAQARLPIGKFSVMTNKLYTYNPVEKSRFGLGLETNEKLTSYIRLGAWSSIGIADNRLKYGIDFSIYPTKKPLFSFLLGHSFDLRQSGGLHNNQSLIYPFHLKYLNPHSIREFQIRIREYVTTTHIALHFRSLRTLSHLIGLKQETIIPAYNYIYNLPTNNSIIFNHFRTTEVYTGFRIAIKEQYISYLNNQFHPEKTANTIFEMNYIRGFRWESGSFDYQKICAGFQTKYDAARWGILQLRITGGYLTGQLPYPLLYVFQGNNEKLKLGIPFTFETMYFNEFVADKFFTFFSNWTIINTRFPHKNWRPNLSVIFSAAGGTIKNSHLHAGEVRIKSPENIFLETGVLFTQILPRSWTRSFPSLQFTGLGGYFRMGSYRLANFEQNMVFRITFQPIR